MNDNISTFKATCSCGVVCVLHSPRQLGDVGLEVLRQDPPAPSWPPVQYQTAAPVHHRHMVLIGWRWVGPDKPGEEILRYTDWVEGEFRIEVDRTRRSRQPTDQERTTA